MIFDDLKLKKRLYYVIGLLILLIFASGQWNIYQSKRINDRVKNIYTQELLPLENISNLKSALYRIRDKTLRLSNAKNLQEVQKYQQSINEQLKRISSEIDIYDNTRLSYIEKQELSKFKKNLQEYMQIIKTKVYPLLDTFNNEDNINNILFKEAILEFREAREALNKISEYQIQRAQKRHTNANNIYDIQWIITQIIIILVIIFSILISKKLINAILIPINKIYHILLQIKNLDFNTKITYESTDEFGEIVSLLNNNIELLHSTFTNLDVATHDTLTKLPNRLMFKKELLKYNENYKYGKYGFSVILINIDNFKRINDIHGHDFGDKLLLIISQRIKKELKNDEFFARIGGDEYAVILTHDKYDNIFTKLLVKKIIKELKKPFQIFGISINSSVSIGIFVSEQDINYTTKDIMSFVDLAMHKAKKLEKDKYLFFNHKMYEELQEDIELEESLKLAITNKEFILYFQPIINLQDGTLYGAETLLRWNRDGNIVAPYKFIPKLESSGMIKDVTYMIIKDVFEMIEKQSFQGVISINISILQFYDDNFIPFLQNIVKQYPNVMLNKIVLEITETVFSENCDYIYDMMQSIKAIGFKFSLDDFGTGYSSLSYIKDYPISTLKVDKTFVDNISLNRKNIQLLDSIIHMAKNLEMNVVIEGVEDKETIELIKTLNYDVNIQGYYYYKPMPSSEFTKMI